MPELAVSRVNLARACTYASLSNCSETQTNKDRIVSVRQQTGGKYCEALWFWLRYLYGEDACYPDGAAYSFQAQRCHFGVVAVLQAHAESSQERRPCQLRNGGQITVSFVLLSTRPAACAALAVP